MMFFVLTVVRFLDVGRGCGFGMRLRMFVRMGGAE